MVLFESRSEVQLERTVAVLQMTEFRYDKVWYKFKHPTSIILNYQHGADWIEACHPETESYGYGTRIGKAIMGLEIQMAHAIKHYPPIRDDALSPKALSIKEWILAEVVR